MKKTLMLLVPTIILLLFSACKEWPQLICDECGASFAADRDYSKELEKDADIQAALGIDLYSFFCPECRNEYMGAMVVRTLNEEESELLSAYENGGNTPAITEDTPPTPAPTPDDNIEILESTNMEPYYIAVDVTTGLYGIYNISEGIWNVEARFSMIEAYGTEGVALAKENDFYGYIDQMGNTVIGFQFSEAGPFVNGVARVFMNKWGAVNENGSFVVDPMFEDLTVLDNGYISVYDGEGYGLYDNTGKMIVEANYLDGFKFTPTRIYACKYTDAVRAWYEIFDYTGKSLMDTIPENKTVDRAADWPLYVSYPDEGLHIVCYNLYNSRDVLYKLYDNDFETVFDMTCGYISELSSFGYAVVIPVPGINPDWSSTNRWYADNGQQVIDKTGKHICTLPELPDYNTDYKRSIGERRRQFVRYDYYVNQDCVIALDMEVNSYQRGRGYLIDIQTLDTVELTSINLFKGTNYVAAKDINTNLWCLYDGSKLVDSNCTEIGYRYQGDNSDMVFSLYHGNEYKEYPSSSY